MFTKNPPKIEIEFAPPSFSKLVPKIYKIFSFKLS